MPLASAVPRAAFPAGLQEVIDRALEYDAGRRYASAPELGRAALAVAASLPETRVAASSSGSAGRAVRSRLSPWTLAGATAGMGAAVAMAVWILGGGAPELQLDPAPGRIRAGDTVQVRLLADGEPVDPSRVTWRSADPAVVEVQANGGALLGRLAGSTTVIATLAADSVIGAVEVVPGPVARVAIAPSTLTLTPGESATVAAGLFDRLDNPVPGEEATVRVENPGIATLENDGRVRAARPGRTRLFASAVVEGVELTDTLSVTVAGNVGPTPPESSATTDPTPEADAEATLRRLFQRVLTADATTARAYRDTAQTFWNLGDRLDSQSRGLAAFIAGQASDLIGESGAAETWWCRAEALGIDTRRAYLVC